jgi:rod shape-determining protein MreC
MIDEKVEAGEEVLTSGGDRIFPKGLRIGTVAQVTPGPDLFLTVRVRPAARINQLEEVLVITKVVEKQQENTTPSGPVRAADLLARRLPTVEIRSTPTIEGGKPNRVMPPPPTSVLYANKPGDKTAPPPPTSALYGTTAKGNSGSHEGATKAGKETAAQSSTGGVTQSASGPTVQKPKVKKAAQPTSVSTGFAKAASNEGANSETGPAATTSGGAAPVSNAEPTTGASEAKPGNQNNVSTEGSSSGTAAGTSSSGSASPSATDSTNTGAGSLDVLKPTVKKPTGTPDKSQPAPPTSTQTPGGPDGGHRR